MRLTFANLLHGNHRNQRSLSGTSAHNLLETELQDIRERLKELEKQLTGKMVPIARNQREAA